MVMNTGILRDVHADEYGFGLGDLAVAAILKAYLQELNEEAAEYSRAAEPPIRCGVSHVSGQA